MSKKVKYEESTRFTIKDPLSALACAAIEQAIIDAKVDDARIASLPRHLRYELSGARRSARAFLKDKSEGGALDLWCQAAGFSAEYIHRHVIEALEREGEEE